MVLHCSQGESPRACRQLVTVLFHVNIAKASGFKGWYRAPLHSAPFLLLFWTKLQKSWDWDVHSDSLQFYTLDKHLHLCKESIKICWSSIIVLYTLWRGSWLSVSTWAQEFRLLRTSARHLLLPCGWSRVFCTMESSSTSSSRVPILEDSIRHQSKAGAQPAGCLFPSTPRQR